MRKQQKTLVLVQALNQMTSLLLVQESESLLLSQLLTRRWGMKVDRRSCPEGSKYQTEITTSYWIPTS